MMTSSSLKRRRCLHTKIRMLSWDVDITTYYKVYLKKYDIHENNRHDVKYKPETDTTEISAIQR